MSQHSIKVPRLYKVAATVCKEAHEGIGSIKHLVYEKKKKHPNIKAMYALVSTLFHRKLEVEKLLKRSQFLTKEPKSDPWLIKILIVELLWGKKRLPGQSKPENTVRAYEQIFKAHLSDSENLTIEEHKTKGYNMADVVENTPLFPPHTRQASKALGLLLFFSLLMFTLPFVAFFLTKYILINYFLILGFANTIWSVIAAVLVVNWIIVAFAYIAYHEPELDEHGNVIKSDKKHK